MGRDVAEAYGIELAARAAVNTGPVVIPAGEAPADITLNALGDTVNVAARLQAHARPGGVVVGALTAHQVEAQFELESLGELELKGRSERVSAFQIRGPRIARTGAPPVPLVGRANEVATIERVFGGVLAGRGAILSITGEPGIGKSRLVREARGLFGDDVVFLEGAGVSYAEAIPYWPVRAALRSWLGFGVSEPEARVRIELKARLAALLGDGTDAVQPFLVRLLGLNLDPDGEQRLQGLGTDSVQLQTFAAVREVLLAQARSAPVCLVLDDLHFADDATLALIEELLRAVDEEAIVIMLLYRSEREHGAWRLGERARQRFPHRHVELELQPLGEDDSRALAGDTAGGEVPADVASLLAERCGGNPFFLQEALRDLIEQGILRRENGGYAAVGHLAVDVPALVQEALQARLDRLDPELRELVAIAAVVGQSFGLPLLERLAPRLPLPPLLADLQRLELIVEERRRPAAEYRFRHGLVREVAYGSLLESRRRELHRAVGESLEAIHGDASEEVIGLLAYHFAQADVPDRAGRYLIAAGDAARAAHANDEAIGLYERAVPFLDRVGDAEAARATLFKLGLTHHLAFDFARSNAAYAAAFARPGPERAREVGTETLVVGHLMAHTCPTRTSLLPGRDNNSQLIWIVEQLFRGLLSFDDQLNVVPDVASSFRVSDDGRRFRFELRTDAVWSDGTAVTAADFAFAWTSLLEEQAQVAYLIELLDRVEVIDERTLEVEFAEARPYLPYLFCFHGFFPWPRHRADQLGMESQLAQEFVGNGPFVLAELDDRHALLRSNTRWCGSRGNVGEATVKFTTFVEAMEGWRAEEFDLGVVANDAFDDETSRVLRTRGMATSYIGFAVVDSPLSDVRVRRALAHALDRDALRFEDPAEPSDSGGLIPPSLPAHSHDLALAYDPERARGLLAEAGFPGGRGLRELRFVSAGRFTKLPRSAIEQWAELGVSVAFEVREIEEIDASLAEMRFDGDIFWGGWIADYPDPEGFLDTLLAANPTIHRDEEVVDLLARARSSRSQSERWGLYRDVDRRLVHELASIIPLAHVDSKIGARRWVEGVTVDPLRALPLLDKLNVRR